MIRRVSLLACVLLLAAGLGSSSALGQTQPEVEGELSISVSPPSPGYIGEQVTVFVHDSTLCEGRESDVLFMVSGAHTLEETVRLDANGDASFTYVGTSAGRDAITAEVEYHFPEPVCDKTYVPSTTTFEWLDQTMVQGELELSISPGAPGWVGDEITVVARDPDPCLDGDYKVLFEVSGANEASQEVTMDPSQSDEVSFTYVGVNAGLDRVSARIVWQIGPCGNFYRQNPTINRFEWVDAICAPDEALSLSVTPTSQSVDVGGEAAFLVDTLCDGVPQSGATVDISVVGGSNFTDSVETPAEWAYSSASEAADTLTFSVEGSDAEATASVDWNSPTGTYDELTAHEKQAVIAAHHPQFTSVSIGEDSGALLITATSADVDLPAIQETIAQVYEMPQLIDLTPIARVANYPFFKLLPWYDALSRQVGGSEGVVHTYIENETGVIVVGVSSPTGTADVLAVADDLGIPNPAVRVEPAQLPEPQISVRDGHRPVVGGLQATGYKECTLGFNAYRQGEWGFVTNAHCTATYGASDGTRFGQPYASPTLADEWYDPGFTTRGKCPRNMKCRFSDTMFAKYVSATTGVFTLGRIAQPPLNDITWNESDRYVIRGKKTPLDNTKVVKVGRSTGRTNGLIVDDCVGTGVGGYPNIWLFCQMTADYGHAQGDSGSPVFSSSSTGAFERTLHGIHWGGFTGQVGYFSPWSNINKAKELGAMTVCGQELYTC